MNNNNIEMNKTHENEIKYKHGNEEQLNSD